MAHSLASAPLLQKKTRPAAADQAVEGGGHLALGLGAVQVGDVQQGAGLVGDGVGHRRVGVAERGDGQAGQEVEVRAALVVPQPAALAPDEGDRLGRVGVHQTGASVMGVTIVPTPSSVKISSSRAWARPAVEDVGVADAVAHGPQAGRDLGDHALADGAVAEQRLQLVGTRSTR